MSLQETPNIKSHKNYMPIDNQLLLSAYRQMMNVRAMAALYDLKREECKYVHSTSRGHEAIQLAVGMQLQTHDWVSPYYRDESLLLAMGHSPYDLMLQLLAKRDDPFSGGRSYYSHPAYRGDDKPNMLHSSSATGMQGIPATGISKGIQYINNQIKDKSNDAIVVCSLGDGSMTEGEVSEALQFATLHQTPILFLVQDNDWGISVTGDEARAMNAYEYAAGFPGLERLSIDGSDFIKSYDNVEACLHYVRNQRRPMLLHAKVPLLGHHTSGVRKEWYRSEEDLENHAQRDPAIRLYQVLIDAGVSHQELIQIEQKAAELVKHSFDKALSSADPDPAKATDYVLAPTPILEEKGVREPTDGESTIMVDAALHAIEELMRKHPECLFYGQDVGGRLGGVFREAATLAQKFGDDRVFNTAIQEALIIGSTAGMSALGLKPIVEVQFGDYIYPGINQLVSEISKSNYISCGKYPVSMILRVPVGAYGGGGPYHSGSVETMVSNIKGIKVAYPSNAADMKGLMKAAYYDPNPVLMLEHKGLYWSKVPGTDDAKCIEPDENYILPLGKARIVQEADSQQIAEGNSICIICYGMGVYWSKAAAKDHPGQIEILDLRTLNPLDTDLIYERVRLHSRCLVLTEESLGNSYAESLAHKIGQHCYEHLDGPVHTLGAADTPAIPINLKLEAAVLPTAEKVSQKISEILQY